MIVLWTSLFNWFWKFSIIRNAEFWFLWLMCCWIRAIISMIMRFIARTLREGGSFFFSFLVRIFHYGMIGRRSSFAKGRLFSSYSCLWLIFATSNWFHKWIFVVFGWPFHVHPFFSWNTLKFLPCILRQYLPGMSQKFDTLLLPNLYLPLHHMK